MKTTEQLNFQSDLIRLREQLYYYALRLTASKEDADDLVQETSYKALKHHSGKKDYEHTQAWLYTILKNTYINHLRSGYNRNILSDRDDPNHQLDYAAIAASDQPDKILFRKELREKIKSLPLVYGEPLNLFLSGYSYKEIAEKTGVPIGTIKSRIHLARGKIMQIYGQC